MTENDQSLSSIGEPIDPTEWLSQLSSAARANLDRFTERVKRQWYIVRVTDSGAKLDGPRSEKEVRKALVRLAPDVRQVFVFYGSWCPLVDMGKKGVWMYSSQTETLFNIKTRKVCRANFKTSRPEEWALENQAVRPAPMDPIHIEGAEEDFVDGQVIDTGSMLGGEGPGDDNDPESSLA
jgi:hypothetical protein